MKNFYAGWVALLGFGYMGFAKAPPPNVLILLADDCTYSDLPLFGGRNAKTPHIDQLASEGLVFNQAFVGMSMCTPSRSELYTGLYPASSGAAWNHSATRPGTRSICHHLAEAGYRVGLAGKKHVKPRSVYPFEDVPGYDPNCVRAPTQAHDVAGVREFMARSDTQPFALVVALVEPHIPWVMGDASAYPPSSLKLPPHIADTPRTREDFSSYLAEITYMDGQVGELLGVLGQVGKAESTLVLFSSEQGSQFPGCKWTNWQAGIHTALVVRWPGRIEGGRRSDALVQYADVLPTLVEVAGGKVASSFDGKSFLGVLEGKASKHREWAYAMHNNFPEGPPYPIRSVHDGRYHYIRNLRPDRLYIEKHLMGDGNLNNPYWATWIRDSTDDENTNRLINRYMRRPGEELYDTQTDPHEMNNLSADPRHRAVLGRLSKSLDEWLASETDPGMEMDTPQAFQANKKWGGKK